MLQVYLCALNQVFDFPTHRIVEVLYVAQVEVRGVESVRSKTRIDTLNMEDEIVWAGAGFLSCCQYVQKPTTVKRSNRPVRQLPPLLAIMTLP